jgi:pantothenate kinase
MLQSALPDSIVVPMDGYHFYKSHLSEMPDPALAFARRGAAWTFDSEKFVSDLESSKQNQCGLFPSFDHSVGDPMENDIAVKRDHKYVIVEGLYLLVELEPWARIKDIVDISIFVDSDVSVLTDRLVERHMRCFKMSREEATHRALNNDIPNSIEIIAGKHRADVIIVNN